MDFRWLEGLTSKVRLMIGRAVISALQHDGAINRAQLKLLAGEIQDNVEQMQEYGFASAAKPGAEAAVIFLGGNRDAGLVIATHDRRYRIALETGEVVIFDDLDQKVHLKRDGIEIVSENRVLVDAPLLQCTGEIKDHIGTMQAMRDIYNSHVHVESTAPSGSTATPTQTM